MANKFIPTSRKEMDSLGWDNVDVIIFSADAYIDHPSFGTAVIARVLEHEGYRVAVVPQPNWRDDLRDFKKLGKPRLFFGVSGGAMDSMVNHYTAAKRRRSDDAYTPNGVAGMRPDYAVTIYSNILKGLWPEVPIVIGGIEASLRRLTHYDYWQDKLFPSVLISSKADYLIYGMGEKPIVQLASHIKKNKIKGNIWGSDNDIYNNSSISQIAWFCKSNLSNYQDKIMLHSYEECLDNKKLFVDNFNKIEINANAMYPKQLVEPYGDGFIYVNPPFSPATEEEMDSYYNLPFTKLPHPRYKEKRIPAYDMIKFSINTHRGCFGGCNFCTIAAHQGRFIQNRTENSILKEIENLKEIPGFVGNVSDVGGPTANMYGMGGIDKGLCSKCVRKSCLAPKMCLNLNHSHKRLLDLYVKIAKIEGIRHAYIGSGIRYDLFLDANGFLSDSNGKIETSRKFFEELVLKHTSGRLKVAPEHTEKHVLELMNKPDFSLFERLEKEFDKIVSSKGLKYQLVPYFISSHPGCSVSDMEKLSRHKILRNVYMEQVQDFTPTPMTASSVMYYSGMSLKDYKSIFIERNINKKKNQKLYFFKKF